MKTLIGYMERADFEHFNDSQLVFSSIEELKEMREDLVGYNSGIVKVEVRLLEIVETGEE
jgi:hypothetical protein